MINITFFKPKTYFGKKRQLKKFPQDAIQRHKVLREKLGLKSSLAVTNKKGGVK